MSNDIRSIIERLAILEGRITPTTVKSGLNPEQKAAKQLPALFKPKDISPTLSKPPYQKHPMDGWLVGEEEETDEDKEVVEEAQANEDKLLDKVKKSLTDYLTSIEDKYRDQDLKDKVNNDQDLGKKDSKDRDLVAKEKQVKEDPTQDEPADTDQVPEVPQMNPTYAESAPVKTVELTDGRLCEIHGNEQTGFEIRHGNRSLKSRFKKLAEAEMALELYRSRCNANNESADYIEEK